VGGFKCVVGDWLCGCVGACDRKRKRAKSRFSPSCVLSILFKSRFVCVRGCECMGWWVCAFERVCACVCACVHGSICVCARAHAHLSLRVCVTACMCEWVGGWVGGWAGGWEGGWVGGWVGEWVGSNGA